MLDLGPTQTLHLTEVHTLAMYVIFKSHCYVLDLICGNKELCLMFQIKKNTDVPFLNSDVV